MDRQPAPKRPPSKTRLTGLQWVGFVFLFLFVVGSAWRMMDTYLIHQRMQPTLAVSENATALPAHGHIQEALDDGQVVTYMEEALSARSTGRLSPLLRGYDMRAVTITNAKTSATGCWSHVQNLDTGREYDSSWTVVTIDGETVYCVH